MATAGDGGRALGYKEAHELANTVRWFIENLKEHFLDDMTLDPGHWYGDITEVDDGPTPGSLDVLYKGMRITLLVLEVAKPSK